MMEKKTRIELTDTIQDIVVKLSEGNPGALSVLMQLFNESAKIDPQDMMKELGCFLSLDSFGVYGSRIWMLYKDVCKENIVKTCVMLRAVQLGFVSQLELNTAIDNYGEGIDLNELHLKVCDRLEEFKKPETM